MFNHTTITSNSNKLSTFLYFKQSMLSIQMYAYILRYHVILARRPDVMLKNSYQVMQRIREEKGIVEYPLFSRSEIRHATECLRSIRFGDTIVVEKENDKLEITFYPAGHIPGACAVSLQHKHRKIFISGDVLFSKMNTLKGANFPNNRVDTLILETTRGATESPEEKDRLAETNRLVESISHTLENGGSVLVYMAS